MIEKIGTKYYEKLSTPNEIVINLTKKRKQKKSPLRVMEIGVGIGATSLELYKILSEDDELYLLDYDEKVKLLKDDLNEYSSVGPQLIILGNSRKLLDSYAWSVMKLALEQKKFDIVFLDGAHTFVFDGIVCSLMESLLNEEGYLVVDDVSFRMADLICHNSSKAEYMRRMYTEEQIEEKQLEKALQCYIYSNKRFEEVYFSKSNVKVFVKRGR